MIEENHNNSNNTTMIIIIVAAAILLLGIIGYFVFGKNEVKDAIDDTTESIESISDTKTTTNVKGSYQALISSNAMGEEADDTSEKYIELVLSDNNVAKLVNSSESTDVLSGTYTVTDTKVTVMTKQDDTQGNQTYEFTINEDKLEYDGIVLNKVDNDILKYIK